MTSTTIDRVDSVIVTASDENYFALAKGLILSILESGELNATTALVFIDLQCGPESLAWLAEQGVHVVSIESLGMGQLANRKFGYHRAQICRAFLDRLVSAPSAIVWVDCDTWFQDFSFVNDLIALAKSDYTRIFAAPELHFTYPADSELALQIRATHRSIYEELYGDEIADALVAVPVVNSGFLVSNSENLLWREWRKEVSRIFLDGSQGYGIDTLHFAEQASFNKLTRETQSYSPIDPLCNYLSLWTPPVREDSGRVVTAGFPPTPVNLVHLAGGWRKFGAMYLERNLLYREGSYLSQAETLHLRQYIGDCRVP